MEEYYKKIEKLNLDFQLEDIIKTVLDQVWHAGRADGLEDAEFIFKEEPQSVYVDGIKTKGETKVFPEEEPPLNKYSKAIFGDPNE